MTEGRRVAGNMHLSLKKSTKVDSADASRCFSWCPHNMSMLGDLRKQNRFLSCTFSGGDESCEQLAEIRTGICIVFVQRKSLQLGVRAAVSEVLSQALGVILEDSCLTQRHKTSGVRGDNQGACRATLVPSEGVEREFWPSANGWEEKGSPKQLEHRTASTTHSPTVIWNTGSRASWRTRLDVE